MHSVSQKSVKFMEMEIKDIFFVDMAEVIMHGRPDVTLVVGAAHHVSRWVISFLLTKAYGIHTSTTIQLNLIIHVACESS